MCAIQVVSLESKHYIDTYNLLVDVRSQSALYDDFPVDPDLEYAAIEKRVFTSLNCSRYVNLVRT